LTPALSSRVTSTWQRGALRAVWTTGSWNHRTSSVDQSIRSRCTNPLRLNRRNGIRSNGCIA